MKDVVPEYNRIRGTNRTGSPTPESQSTASPLVRRRSGRMVIFGLLLGAGLVQAGLVVSFNWEDWQDPGPVVTTWAPADPASQNPVPIQTGPRDAFYPPPGWDDGLFSSAQDADPVGAPYAQVGQPSFGELLQFLNGLQPAVPEMNPANARQNQGPEIATFQQASTSGP